MSSTRIHRIFGRLAFAALLLTLGAGVAQAQEYPLGSAYFCNWEKPNPSNPTQKIYGKSLVTFKNLTGDDFSKTGTLLTVQATGSSSEKSATVSWDWGTWTYNRFTLVVAQDPPQQPITCKLTTSNASQQVVFSQCSNGSYQSCTQ